MQIECRSTQQIEEDAMFEALDSINRDIRHFILCGNAPGYYFLQGARRERAKKAVQQIEGAILEGRTMEHHEVWRLQAAIYM